MAAIVIGIGIALSAIGTAQAVPRACCLPNGDCEILSRSICEDQEGGVSEAIGTDCSTVDCPVLCGGSAPACDGECPTGEVCVVWLDSGGATGSAAGRPMPCACAEEIPEGGACNPLADACAPGLSCLNGVCAVPAAGAPAVSPLGMAVLGGVLLALGGVGLMRRR